MRTTPLSTHSLLELIGLFEQSSQSITDTDGQRLRGVPGWELSRRTALSANELATWTECVGYAGGYPAPCGDETVMVDLEEDDDPSRYRYRCPETFRLKHVAAPNAAIYAPPSCSAPSLICSLSHRPCAKGSSYPRSTACSGVWARHGSAPRPQTCGLFVGSHSQRTTSSDISFRKPCRTKA